MVSLIVKSIRKRVQCKSPLLRLAYFSKTNDRPYILLDYYAVLSGLRGTGIGSRFFPLLREELRDVCAILLEVESVESTEDENEKTLRRRRIAFYERNGCAVTNVPCRSPPRRRETKPCAPSSKASTTSCSTTRSTSGCAAPTCAKKLDLRQLLPYN